MRQPEEFRSRETRGCWSGRKGLHLSQQGWGGYLGPHTVEQVSEVVEETRCNQEVDKPLRWPKHRRDEAEAVRTAL